MIAEPIDGCPRCKIAHGPDDPRLCERCGHVHDPTRCPRHAKDPDGVRRPCRNRPRKNLTVCGFHGGDAPQSQAAAERRGEVEQAERMLARLPRPVRRIDNPLEAIKEYAGEVRGWYDLAASKAAELQEWTVGEHAVPRGELVLLQRFMAECRQTLAEINKMNIDQRLAEVTEAQANSLRALMATGLGAYNDKLDLSAEQRALVPAAAEELRAAVYAEVARRLEARR